MAKGDENKDPAEQADPNAEEAASSGRSRGRARGRASGSGEESDGGPEASQDASEGGDPQGGLDQSQTALSAASPNDWAAVTKRTTDQQGQVGTFSAQPTGSSSVTGQTSPDQNAPQAATPRALQPGEPGWGLRPGDLGYAPPARIAAETGKVLTHQDLGWTGGTDASVNVHGQVPLAMPAPAPPTATSASEYMKPSLISKPAANAVLSKMVGDTKRWIMDLPHDFDGENAVVVQFFRDLIARGAAIGTAQALGRTVEPDSVDAAHTTPPPEFFTLRHLAAQLTMTKQIYDQALQSAGVQLGSDDKQKVEGIAAEFSGLAQGPKSQEEVVKPEDDQTKPNQADQAKSQPQMAVA